MSKNLTGDIVTGALEIYLKKTGDRLTLGIHPVDYSLLRAEQLICRVKATEMYVQNVSRNITIAATAAN